MTRWFLMIFGMLLIAFFGCSGSSQSPVSVDPTRSEQAFSNDYTYFVGKTDATSWGNVYLNGQKIGYGNLPIKCGDYVYFIQYMSDFIPPSTPPKTVPVKYNIATGAITPLASQSSGYDMWTKIDATLSGTVMYGKFSVTTIKKGTKTINLSYAYNAELSDDGNWVFYVQNNKAYRMNLATMQKTCICSMTYTAEVATNADGSKALIVVQSGGKYNLYLWSASSGLSTIGTGYAYYNGIDMNRDGLASFSVNGKCYWLDGSPKLAGTGVYPAVDNGIMLFANKGNLMSYNMNTGTTMTVTSYPTAIQFIEWGRSNGAPAGPEMLPPEIPEPALN